MQRLWIWCCLVVFLVTGCGGSSMAPGRAKSASAPPADVAAYTGASAGPSYAGEARDSAPESRSEMAPAPAAPSQPGATAAAPPRERPGLGTEWGESRSSRVHDVSFTRDGGRPFAVAALHYNDRRGIQAMASFHAARSGGQQHALQAAGGAISVSVVDGDDNPLEAVRVGDRTFVMGNEGERYAIVLTNHTDHRFESVATVDGLDVINGQPGTTESRGYVLMPYATLRIEGFRQSQSEVAAFRFARVADSYAAQTGSARNVGVIGVAFFAERGDRFDPYTFSELHTRETASPFPSDPRWAQPPRR